MPDIPRMTIAQSGHQHTRACARTYARCTQPLKRRTSPLRGAPSNRTPATSRLAHSRRPGWERPAAGSDQHPAAAGDDVKGMAKHVLWIVDRKRVRWWRRFASREPIVRHEPAPRWLERPVRLSRYRSGLDRALHSQSGNGRPRTSWPNSSPACSRIAAPTPRPDGPRRSAADRVSDQGFHSCHATADAGQWSRANVIRVARHCCRRHRGPARSGPFIECGGHHEQARPGP